MPRLAEPRLLWSGEILDTHTTIATLDDECTIVIWGMANHEITYAGQIDVTHGEGKTPSEIVDRLIESLKTEYLAGELARKKELINGKHIKLQ